MPSTVGRSRNFGMPREHLARQLAVVRLLRVHAEPGVVLDAVLRGALRLELGELPEVVLDALAVLRSHPAQNAGSVTATQPVSAICW